jgi:ParB family transcriptional regulator, chromosome partitioning protein
LEKEPALAGDTTMSTTTPDKRKALGRGIDALLPSSRPNVIPTIHASAASGVTEIPLDSVDPNPYQTRKTISEDAINELAASIKANGVVQPIVVRPHGADRYQLIAGQRRLMACKRAGAGSIPAIIKRVSDQQAIEITIIENLQREDLNPVEQATAFHRLSTEFGMTQDLISLRTGKERSAISNHLRLLKLPETGIEALRDGRMSFGHGKVLLMLLGQHETSLPKVIDRVLEQNLSVRQTEELVHKLMAPDGAAADLEVKAQPAKDPNVKAAEAALKSALGCKVDITDRGGKGKIVLQYATIEDFDRIMDALGAKA